MAYQQKVKGKVHGNAKYTKAVVAEWRRIMKENNWNQKELAAHLGIGSANVCRIFQRDAYGELPT